MPIHPGNQIDKRLPQAGEKNVAEPARFFLIEKSLTPNRLGRKA